ncbi:MAG: hypothetical protein HY368_02505 [Candidatus Aenigmarchaeota archaeon]|nr:hypothetical protein [Candidatus Aenigmarchaeota archaeon]
MAKEDTSRIYSILQELVRRSSEFSSRMRMLEQRLDAVEGRLASLESSSLERTKKVNTKFVEADVTLRNLNDEVLRIKNVLEKINRQIGKFARKRDVREVEKMLELLGPAGKPLEEEVES